MSRRILVLMISTIAVLALVLTGCSVTTSSLTNPNNVSQANTVGKLEIRVTDAPAKENITKIMVKVNTIEVRLANANDQKEDDQNEGAQETESESKETGGWQQIDVSGSAPFDLFKVKDNPQTLTTIQSAAGKYAQVRLEVDWVEVTFTADGKSQTEKATVPSGKIKFNHAFEVAADGKTSLLFDFDAAQSVHVTGNGKVMFKPVIKLDVSKTKEKESDDEDSEQHPAQTPSQTPATNQLYVSTSHLEDGMVGVAYSAPLAAANGSLPYTWTLKTGSLPGGLALSNAGLISGTPTASGNFSFTVQVQENSAEKKVATRNLTLKIAAAGVHITTTALPAGQVNAVYPANVKIEAAGGTAPYTWTIKTGTLPAGLSWDLSTGKVTGTPTTAGTYNLTVKVVDSSQPAQNDTQDLVIVINPAS